MVLGVGVAGLAVLVEAQGDIGRYRGDLGKI